MAPQTTFLEEINYFKYLSEWRVESKRSPPPLIAHPFTIQQSCKLLGPPTLEELSHTANYLSVRQNQGLA